MPKYRVKQGQKFGPGGRYPAGTILELSEREAKPFADKLERVEDTALAGSTRAVVPHEDPQFQNELGVEVPEDLKIMPGTVNDPDLDVEDKDEPEAEVPEEPAARRQRQSKSSGKSTRKRATEE